MFCHPLAVGLSAVASCDAGIVDMEENTWSWPDSSFESYIRHRIRVPDLLDKIALDWFGAICQKPELLFGFLKTRLYEKMVNF